MLNTSRASSVGSFCEQLESRQLLSAAAKLPLSWADQFGSTSHDVALGVAADKQGNVIVVGEFSGTVDFDPSAKVANVTSGGGTDIFVIKLNSKGRMFWAEALGGPQDDTANAVAVDQKGNVYVTGSYQGTADFGPGVSLTSNGGSDAFVLKLDSTGKFVWAKSFGGPNFDRGSAIAVDKLGNVYFTGDYVTTGDFDPGPGTFTLTSAGFRDPFAVKLNSDGSLAWAKSFGGPAASEEGEGIALDKQGNVYLTGTAGAGATFDSISLPNNGSYDAYVAKLNNSGTVLWAKNLGGSDFDRGFAIAVDQQGNVYSTGEFTGSGDFNPGASTFTLTSNGGEDIFVTKLDTNGNFVWANSAGGPNDDLGLGIAVSTNRDVYVTGSFIGTADFNPAANKTFNLTSATTQGGIYVWKLNKNGIFNTAVAISGTGFAVADGIALSHGGVYLAGSFSGTLDANPGPAVLNLISNGDFDALVVKLKDSPANSIFV